MQEQGDKGAMRGVGGGKTMGTGCWLRLSVCGGSLTLQHTLSPDPGKPDKESYYLQICACLHTSVLKSCTGIPMCICTHGVCDMQGCVHADAVCTKS